MTLDCQTLIVTKEAPNMSETMHTPSDASIFSVSEAASCAGSQSDQPSAWHAHQGIYCARGIDGLSRQDRERIANYSRVDFLFDKFLNARVRNQSLQLTHEHILKLGDASLSKLKLVAKETTDSGLDRALRKETQRLERQLVEYKKDLERQLQAEFEKAKRQLRNDYDTLMQRIEKQRDQAEDERLKELARKLTDECEEALRRQWQEAEELRCRSIDELRDIMRREIYAETEQLQQRAVYDALKQAEAAFLKREASAMQRTRDQCEAERIESERLLCNRYDASIEALLQKLKEADEKLRAEQQLRTKLDADFRLLQTDYKRFMNYTNHYNSDYMMKLRHIGDGLTEDAEFESVLNEKLSFVDTVDKLKAIPKRTFSAKRTN